MKRNTRVTLFFAALLLTAGSLLSCATKLPPPTEFESAPLLGMIYNAEGMPVHNATITIDSDPGPTTDINGRFIIPDVRRGIHHVSVSARDYEPVTVEFAFLNKTQIMYVRIFNAGQLLAKAEAALESMDYDSAREFINRSLALNEKYSPALYLKAILYYKQEEYAKSAEILESMINSGRLYPQINDLLSLVRNETQEEN